MRVRTLLLRRQTTIAALILFAVVIWALQITLAANSTTKSGFTIPGLTATFYRDTGNDTCVATEIVDDAEAGMGSLNATSASEKRGRANYRYYSAIAKLTLQIENGRGVVRADYNAAFGVVDDSIGTTGAKQDNYISMHESGKSDYKIEESKAELFESGILTAGQTVEFEVYNKSSNGFSVLEKTVPLTRQTTVSLSFSSIQFIPYYQLTMGAAVPDGTGSSTVDGAASTTPQADDHEYSLQAIASNEDSSFACWYVSEDDGKTFKVLDDGVCGVTITEGNRSSDKIKVTLTKDVTIQPRFISNNFATTFMPGINGTITVSGDGLDATEITGSEGQSFGLKAKEYAYEVTAAPNDGYLFTGFHIVGEEGTFDVPVPFDRNNRYTLVMQLYGAGCKVTPQFASRTSVTLKSGIVETVDFKETGTEVKDRNPVDSTSPQMTYRYSVVASGGVLTSGEIGAKDQMLDVPDGCTIQLEPLLEKGYIFSGWYKSEANKIDGAEAIYDWVAPVGGDTLQPYCMDARNAAFQVGSKIFNNWDTAMTAALKGTGKVILINDVELGSLSADENASTYIKKDANGRTQYIVPNGIAFILPYQNGADTYNASNDNSAPYANTTWKSGDNAFADSNVYLTLSLANNADMVVQSGGVLTVGGIMGSTAHTIVSYTIGKTPVPATHSNIELLEGGSIRVQSGGVLSVCGFIYGAGTVTAESGAKVYQPFAIMDFGGGGYTVGVAAGAATRKNSLDKDVPITDKVLGIALVDAGDMKYPAGEVSAVAPFLRYATDNIQAKMTVHYGAAVYGYVNLYASGQDNTATISVIGTNPDSCVIALRSGASMTTSYDASTYLDSKSNYLSLKPIGKSILEFSGGADMGHLKMGVSLSGTDVTVDCAKLSFPLPYNYEIHLGGEAGKNNEYSISQMLLLLPGTSLIVDENAQLTVNNKLTVLDGLNDKTTGSIQQSAAYLNGYWDRVSDSGLNQETNKASVRSGAYPSSSALGSASKGTISTTARFVVNGKLTLGDSAKFGGLIQTDGSSNATIVVNNSATLTSTEQVGALGSYSIPIKGTYAYAGATRRTLLGQIMSNDAAPVALQNGQTYFGTAADKTLSDYSYTVYYLSSDVNKNETKTETLKASVSGQWYQKSVTYYLQTFIGSNLVKTEKISEKFYLNNETAPLDAPPTSGAGYVVDASWYTDADCTNPRTGALSAGEKITLYAKRSADKFTITAKSADMTTSASIADVSLDGLGTYNLTDSVTFNAPKVKNYTFKGWFRESNNYEGQEAIYTGHVVTEKIQVMVDNGLFDTSTVLNLVAVYESTGETNLTLKLVNAPSNVEVSWDNQAKTANADGAWSVPVGTEVTITVPNSATNFRYWTNANDKVMSRGKTYTFTMVTNTTLTAVTSTSGASTPFVIFQSADERLLKAEAYSENLTLPDAPYRVGYTFAGWKVGSAKATKDLEVLKNTIDALSNKANVVVTAEYTDADSGDFEVTAINATDNKPITSKEDKTTYKLGEIATFEAPAASDGTKAFRFWASNAKGTNILSFSQKYSFRVTQTTTIYAIYGGENKPEVQPVVRVDNVLAGNESSVKSLTFMIGASVPTGYELVEMGALYATTSVNDTTLRVENVGSGNGVYKAVSRLNHKTAPGLADFSYALGFKIPDNNTTIYLRGYVAVKKTGDDTIYYYYSGVTSANYNDVNTQQGG